MSFKIYVKDELKDKEVNKFFRKMIENFAKESFTHWNIWGRFPFIYREKQLNSVLIPAIHSYTKNIWLEEPFINQKKKKRFLDIATVKDDTIFMIELKHSWTHKKGKSKKDWEKSINQISDIDVNTIRSSFNIDYNLIKMALMIAPTYISLDKNKGRDILNLTTEEFTNNLFEDYQNIDKDNSVNLIGTIKIKNPEQYEYKSKYGREIYPFISFIVRVEEVI